MREEQTVDGDDLHVTLLVAAVAVGVVTVNHGDLLPGRVVELAGLTALVVLDREEVVGAALSQVGGVGVLGVESIGGDDRPGEVGIVDLVEQGRELGDLVRLRADLTRGQGDAIAMPDRGQHENPAAVRAFCTAQALAVHRDRPAPATHRIGLGGSLVGPALFALLTAVGHQRRGRCGLVGEQGLQVDEPGRAELGRIESPQHTAQGLLARHPVSAQERVVGQPEGSQFLGGRTPAPLRCRGDRVVARGCHRADHQGQQGAETVAHPAGSARIGERLELGDQAADMILHCTLTQGFQTGRGAGAGSDGR